jgi:hypothetical protein
MSGITDGCETGAGLGFGEDGSFIATLMRQRAQSPSGESLNISAPHCLQVFIRSGDWVPPDTEENIGKGYTVFS